MKEAKQFSILADEVTDVANWEQLAVILRFVDTTNSIREEFIVFVPCEQITGEALTEKILSCLRTWGLQVEDLRGQGYDGGSNMAGKYKGLQARIMQLNQKAIYFHCAAHCLSLCIVKACAVHSIRNMYGTMRELALFFTLSPKRQRHLERILDGCDVTRKQKLVDLCRTRWIETHSSFETLTDLFVYVHQCLTDMETGDSEWDSDTLTKCRGLRVAISSSGFLVSFVTTRNCLRYIKPLSVSLQKKTRDIIEAYAHVEEVATALSDIRADLQDTFAVWFTEAETLAESVNEQVTMPRTVDRQTQRPSQPADTAQEYFRRTIAVPFLDHLLSEFSSRFQNSEIAHGGLKLVADQAARIDSPQHQLPEGIRRLVELWESDLPSPQDTSAEFHRWCVKWRTAADKQQALPSTVTASLQQCSSLFFPNIYVMLKLIASLPVTTASCERTISSLKLLKSCLRSTMSEQRLNGLALMRLHRQIAVNPEAIVDAFSARFKTRMATQPPRCLLGQD